jgi:large subunit ribosomal protein L4
MSKVTVYNVNGGAAGEQEVADGLLELKRGAQAVVDVVTAYRAGIRAGTASTKTRDEVSGGGRKPYKQKGTGRARQGSIRSPILRGGGVVFGPHPRDYSKKVNKKLAALAFRRALSEKLAAGAVVVAAGLEAIEPKTKALAGLLKQAGGGRATLFVTAAVNRNLCRAARNRAEGGSDDGGAGEHLPDHAVSGDRGGCGGTGRLEGAPGGRGGAMNRLVVKKLLLTEKGTRLKESVNQYVFEVDRLANKLEIRRAVEQQFNVKVKDVNTMVRPGKAKRLRTMSYGRTPARKRAVVTLQAGQAIEMA